MVWADISMKRLTNLISIEGCLIAARYIEDGLSEVFSYFPQLASVLILCMAKHRSLVTTWKGLHSMFEVTSIWSRLPPYQTPLGQIVKEGKCRPVMPKNL